MTAGVAPARGADLRRSPTTTPRCDALTRLLSRPRFDDPARRMVRRADADGVDWATVMAYARRHGLGILAGRRLRDVVELPGPVAAAIAAEQRSAAAWGLALAAETARMIALLDAAGVSALPLKGPALALAAYGDVTARRSGDIDLLVPRDQLDAAERALAAAGVRPQRAQSQRERDWYRRTNDKLVHLTSPLVVVEVHGRVHPREFRLDLEGPGIWRRARPIELGGASVPAMSLEDTALVVCTHAGRSGWMRLEWAASLAWLAQRPGLYWELVLELARDIGAVRMVGVGLELARTFGELDPRAEAAARADGRAATFATALSAAAVDFDPGAEQPAGKLPVLRQRLGHLRMRERWRDRLGYVARVIALPTDADARLVALPVALRFLYVPLRLARLTIHSLRMALR